MIWVNSYFLLAVLGWSIFMPFICLFAGWYARGEGEQE